MKHLLYIGQWQGFFKYGAEYGEYLEGQEAEFRMFIENYEAGKFSGRVIDWEGLGAQGEVSKLSGFIDGNFISFTKEYTHLHVIDQWGNTASHSDIPGHMVFYKGVYEQESKCFHGSWKTSPDIVTLDELTIEEVNTGTGTWRMYSHD